MKMVSLTQLTPSFPSLLSAADSVLPRELLSLTKKKSSSYIYADEN